MQGRVARTIKHARNIGIFQYKRSMFAINDPTSEVSKKYQDTKKRFTESDYDDMDPEEEVEEEVDEE